MIHYHKWSPDLEDQSHKNKLYIYTLTSYTVSYFWKQNIMVYSLFCNKRWQQVGQSSAYKNTWSANSLSARGITPWRILKFFICSFFCSTCIRADAILRVITTSTLLNWTSVLNCGLYNLTLFGFKPDCKWMNLLSTITASPFSSWSKRPLDPVISTSEEEPGYNFDTYTTAPVGLTPIRAFNVVSLVALDVVSLVLVFAITVQSSTPELTSWTCA